MEMNLQLQVNRPVLWAITLDEKVGRVVPGEPSGRDNGSAGRFALPFYGVIGFLLGMKISVTELKKAVI
jgi:hypothetical protein